MRSETTYDASVAWLEAKSAGFVSELILLRISSVSVLKKDAILFDVLRVLRFQMTLQFIFRDLLDSTL